MNLEAMGVLEEDQMNMNLTNLDLGMGINMNNMVNNIKSNEFKNISNANINETHTNVSIIADNKIEKKVVVKDNNWINACVVPSKMKTNIISKENEFEEESFEAEKRDYKPMLNSNCYDELTKSKYK